MVKKGIHRAIQRTEMVHRVLGAVDSASASLSTLRSQHHDGSHVTGVFSDARTDHFCSLRPAENNHYAVRHMLRDFIAIRRDSLPPSPDLERQILPAKKALQGTVVASVIFDHALRFSIHKLLAPIAGAGCPERSHTLSAQCFPD